MILQSLNQLYDRLAADDGYQVAAPGYSRQKITFKVVITREGELFDIQDARLPTDGKLHPRPVLVPGGTKPPGSGINPCFLWDNSSYMLGFKPEAPNPARLVESFKAFRARHLELEDLVASPVFSAVCRFLERWEPTNAGQHPVLSDAAATGFGVFQIQGEPTFVHQDATVVRWWESQESSDAQVLGQCLVTGDQLPLARIHRKIKGVAGAQSSGASIAGFNENAYESYAKTQSYNAPVSERAAFRYVTALNALLDGPRSRKHRMTLGDTTVAFWTDRPSFVEDIFVQFASEGSLVADKAEIQDEGIRQKIDAFLQALRRGGVAYKELDRDPDRTRYFVLGLAPNAARISIRFFHEGSLHELLRNLQRHHHDIGLEPAPASGKRPADPEFPPAWMLLRQTARETKDVPPILSGPLLNAIVTGTPYPRGLYSAVIRRIQADRRVSYLRAAVLKGFLTRNMNLEVSMALDSERLDPAYRLGRLFAALEKTQRDALGETLSSTIRDRFYGSASATPGSVFPRLLRTYQHHLAKLEHAGQRVNREKLVQEILAPLDGFPAHLGLTGQGLFAIGYYHQNRDFYTKRSTADGSESSAKEE